MSEQSQSPSQQARSEASQKEQEQAAKDVHAQLDDLRTQADVGNYEGVKAIAETLRTHMTKAGFAKPTKSDAQEQQGQQDAAKTSQGSSSRR